MGSGTYIGTVGAVRHLLIRMFDLHHATFEVDDQALLQVLLLCNRTVGLVDTAAELFYTLGMHDEIQELERPVCGEDYFQIRSDTPEAALFLKVGRPPRVLASWDKRHVSTPAVLHFDGKGSKMTHREVCWKLFRKKGAMD